ncbi:MAG: cag pathogenicity island protein Cag26 [Deltaproteobacteria bacterium]|nr:MAG: cag pathogenicity island protein Cag26 [Deltaproteobacteria bacterium]
MHFFYFSVFRKFWHLVRRDNLNRVMGFIALVLILGSIGMVVFEPDLDMQDAIWWAVVTMTTVGYGDISPASPGGRVVAIGVMLLGIGLLGIFTATVASIFVERRMMENRGGKPVRVRNHFLICGWNYRGKDLIRELQADPKMKQRSIVIIADLPEKPVDDMAIQFVRGHVDAGTLEKANAGTAEVAMVLSEDGMDTYGRDARTILSVMSLKELYPSLYVCAELMGSGNLEQCRMARADEIIVIGELSTNLMVQAALDHGITRMVSELVSNRYGEDLYKIPIPDYFVGNSFFEALTRLKQEWNYLLIGIERGQGTVMTNPAGDLPLAAGDALLIVATDRPDTLA